MRSAASSLLCRPTTSSLALTPGARATAPLTAHILFISLPADCRFSHAGFIGFAAAESLAKEGAHVIVNGRTQRRVDEALSKLRSVGSVRVEDIAADVSGADGCERVIAAFPELDILINNMGSTSPSRSRRSRMGTGCAFLRATS